MLLRTLFCANLCAIGVGIAWPSAGLQDSFESLCTGSGVGFVAGIVLGLSIEIARAARHGAGPRVWE